MAYEKELPEWKAKGVKPPQSKLDEGWKVQDKPPAAWLNWQMNSTYEALQELQEKAVNKNGDTLTGKVIVDNELKAKGISVTQGYFEVNSYGAEYGIGKLQSFYDANNKTWKINGRDSADALTAVDLQLNGRMNVNRSGIQLGIGSPALANFHMVSDDVGGRPTLRIYNGNYGAGTRMFAIDNQGHAMLGNQLNPNNLEGWSKVLDIYSTGNAQIKVRTDVVDGRFEVHDQGFTGGAPGLLIGTASNHDVTFLVGNQNRLSISKDGYLNISSAIRMNSGDSWKFFVDNQGSVYSNAGSNDGGLLHYQLRNNTRLRWGIGLAGNESGLNNGSDFSIWSYDNNENMIHRPLILTRQNTALLFGSPLRATHISNRAPANHEGNEGEIWIQY
ncbi:hypothetical protein MH117_16570 [Paenibacillus sp. ACRRX]|uniref:hypothetical protein n=1 Tax=unclassified Paenibacillus TaxID=185978 RepID=UPI001EF51E8A|nr:MULTISPECIES: hypothetical protein [unclassified Paenibacillus]MCG7409033.1 hypothetical protein [Paenibacillus sp. ACRRX]MDK8181967.1 hypothetical protein [Paenibacillus sp. UMB4589-SE434]